MDNGAVLPESFQISAEAIQPIEDQAIVVAEDADKEVAQLLHSKGWERIVKDIQNDIAKLRTLKGADLAGLSMDKVGEKFLVSSLVADHLQNYLDKVENAAKAVADAERAKQPKR